MAEPEYRFTVPLPVTQCIERLETACESDEAAKKRAIRGVRASFESDANGNCAFTITHQYHQELPRFSARGLLEIGENQSTRVRFRIYASSSRWLTILSAFGFGLLALWFAAGHADSRVIATVGFPLGIGLLLMGALQWSGQYQDRRKLVPFIYDALGAPYKSRPTLSGAVFLISTFGIPLVGIVAIIAAVLQLAAGSRVSVGGAFAMAGGFVLAVIAALGYVFVMGTLSVYWVYRVTGTGRYDRALRLVTLLKYLNPLMHGATHYYADLRGEVLWRAGRYDESEAVFRRSLSTKKPVGSTVDQSSEYCGVAQNRLDQGDLAAARPYLDQALAVRPTSSSAHLLMARWLLLQGGDPDQALAHLDMGEKYRVASMLGLTIGEHLPAIIQASRAWAYAQQGNVEHARRALAEALEPTGELFRPGEAELHYCVAMVESVLGDDGQARQHLHQAIQLDPQGRIAKIAQRQLPG